MISCSTLLKKNLVQLLAFPFVLALFSALLVAETTPPPDLDAYVARVMREFEVPGLAVAIVKDGQIVLAKGYGVRELGKPERVDEHTLFGIASNTKAFTAAALAMLVDEGKISWDDPVVKHLPWFQLYDPYVTRELTIRDLLTHRSGLGLGAGDLLFWPGTTYTRDEILYRMRYVKPASSFRSQYAYDNILYLAAGQIIPAVTGKSWDDFVKERIFAPLGMSSSNTSVSAFKPGDNITTPHARIEGRVNPIKWMNIDNTAPAGAINSSAADIAKWVLVRLNEGKLANGSRLFSEQQAREMWSAQTIMPIGEPPAPLRALKPNFAAYALGFRVSDYRGRKLVDHTGGLAGLVSKVEMVPEENLGIVVLTNQEENGAYQSVIYHILDHYLKLPATDWTTAFRNEKNRQLAEAAEVERRQSTARNPNARPSLPLEKYAGKYNDAWYGTATIKLENGKLVMQLDHTPAMVGELEYWQYDTFKTRWRDRTLADAFVTFVLKADGGIEEMKMAPVSPLADFSFDYQDLLFRPATEKAERGQ
ncbi:MAG TPA: serine hydrolase [Terriglobales bacterium]|nr:serine hydrolase [Terriglobales bacterium]